MLYLPDDMTPEELREAVAEDRALRAVEAESEQDAERMSNYRAIWADMPPLSERIATAREAERRFQARQRYNRDGKAFVANGPWALPDPEDNL